jgi:hypothetical protein
MRDVFDQTVAVIADAIGPRAFRPEKALNAAIFDSVMVGLARRRKRGLISDLGAVHTAYLALLDDEEFQRTYRKATADVDNVRRRLALATHAFLHVA